MSLQLNEPRNDYQAYPPQGTGRYVDLMQNVLRDRRVPMNIAQVMRARLEAANSTTAVRNTWLDNHFFTADGIAYHRDMLRVTLDDPQLRAPAAWYAGGIPQPCLHVVSGPDFRRRDLAKMTNRALAESEAVTHPLWLELARQDKSLLRAYAQLIFAELRAVRGEMHGMGIYVDPPREIPVLRPVLIGRFDSWSGAYASMNEPNARLIGVLPTPPKQPDDGGAIRMSGLCEREDLPPRD